ncbi:uncharacterized protein EURHEDRAFT_408161 [Aspergillus ruber CBS 135680]|uniref:Uncharacterized protein n=1 Tax=Aspergillus ruber (strain CBS 135680) TaxID=1388766 RepID=A0A017SRN2_ASPRC|nr:uncharacterized protein EURHEDRAFT_408161 [Aspergillus ruber CBS 135680]EYE98940.1 hypothetical protein EURHEDRAFT_408161 [Aspergillus ruber CBS 135680]
MYTRRQRRSNDRSGYRNNSQSRYKAVCCHGRRELCYRRREYSRYMGRDRVGAC